MIEIDLLQFPEIANISFSTILESTKIWIFTIISEEAIIDLDNYYQFTDTITSRFEMQISMSLLVSIW